MRLSGAVERVQTHRGRVLGGGGKGGAYSHGAATRSMVWRLWSERGRSFPGPHQWQCHCGVRSKAPGGYRGIAPRRATNALTPGTGPGILSPKESKRRRSCLCRNTTLTEAYEAMTPGLRALTERHASLFPSGLTHDSRHFDPYPLYITPAQGPVKWDVDGNRYVDYFGGHGVADPRPSPSRRSWRRCMRRSTAAPISAPAMKRRSAGPS